MKYVWHTFGPNQTIDAIIHLKNNHDRTYAEELHLRDVYNVMNGGVVPIQGDTCRIPILARWEHLYGSELEIFS